MVLNNLSFRFPNCNCQVRVCLHHSAATMPVRDWGEHWTGALLGVFMHRPVHRTVLGLQPGWEEPCIARLVPVAGWQQEPTPRHHLQRGPTNTWVTQANDRLTSTTTCLM